MDNLRAIKYFSKKIVMRPQNKGLGKTEVWTPNANTVTIYPLQYIIHEGTRYFLQEIKEKT
jgi:hypothetical protein